MDLAPPISTKCRFLPDKVMKDPDVIVIGSGMGGNAVTSINSQYQLKVGACLLAISIYELYYLLRLELIAFTTR